MLKFFPLIIASFTSLVWVDDRDISEEAKYQQFLSSYTQIVPTMNKRVSDRNENSTRTTLQTDALFSCIADYLDAKDLLQLGQVSHLTHYQTRRYWANKFTEFSMKLPPTPNRYDSSVFHRFLSNNKLPKTKRFNKVMKQVNQLANCLIVNDTQLTNKKSAITNYFNANPEHYMVLDLTQHTKGKAKLQTRDVPKGVKKMLLVNSDSDILTIPDNFMSSNSLHEVEINLPKTSHIGTGFFRRSGKLDRLTILMPNLLHVSPSFLANCINLRVLDISSVIKTTFLDNVFACDATLFFVKNCKNLETFIVKANSGLADMYEVVTPKGKLTVVSSDKIGRAHV